MAILPALWLAPVEVFAQIGDPCRIPGLPCIGGGFEGATVYGMTVLFPAVRIGFVAIAVVMFFAYSFRLLLESEEESTITDIKNAYSQAIVGAAFVSICTLLADAFGRAAAPTIINPEPVTTALGSVIFYMRAMTSIAVTALITFQGVRLIILQGQESELEQQRKRFFHGLLGVGILLLANSLVAAVMPGAHSDILATETIGIINYMLQILGALCLLAVIAAGVFLMFAQEDGLKDRAKKAIFTAVVALVVALVAYVIVNGVLALRTGPLTLN